MRKIIRQNLSVLCGDCSQGADREILDFLRSFQYPDVTVFTVSSSPRIPLEPVWKLQTLHPDPPKTPQQKQMAKDRAMAEKADFGLAVFDPVFINRYGNIEVSSGSLRNTIQLLLKGKNVRFYYLYQGSYVSAGLKSLEDLEAVLESYKKEQVSVQETEMFQKAGLLQNGKDVQNLKYSRLCKKYRKLLESEQILVKEETAGLPDFPSTEQIKLI